MATPRIPWIALFLVVVALISADSLLAGEITVQELRERMERGDSFLLIDVREPWERAEFDLGGELIPIGDLLRDETILVIRSKLET